MERTELRLKQLEFKKERLHRRIGFLQTVLIVEGTGTAGAFVKFFSACIWEEGRCLKNDETKFLLVISLVGAFFLLILIAFLFVNYKKLERLEKSVLEVENDVR